MMGLKLAFFLLHFGKIGFMKFFANDGFFHCPVLQPSYILCGSKLIALAGYEEKVIA